MKLVKNDRRLALSLLAMAALVVSSCGSDPASPQPAKAVVPATLAGTAVKESELTSITLSAEAEQRLGIRIEEARSGGGTAPRRFSGEITKPVGSNLVVSSPIAGTLQSGSSGAPVPTLGSMIRKDQAVFTLNPFLPLPPDLRVTAEGDIAQARARVDAARQRKLRADRTLADQVGTVRGQEEAQQELDIANAALQSAEKRSKEIESASRTGTDAIVVRAPQDGTLRQMHVVQGQTIAAGAPMFEIENLSEIWIRVPVYAGEAETLASKGPVMVQALNGTGPTWTAQPVAAPPSADSASSTVDFYYKLSNNESRFKPGEKVSVSLSSSSSSKWIDVPWSSVVFDTNGGSWVYESLGERRFARHRVSLDHSSAGRAYLNAGIAVGTPVVADGAAELWGFEFGTRK